MKTLTIILSLIPSLVFPQNSDGRVKCIDVAYNENFEDFELINDSGKKAYIITEDVHNLLKVPATTLKFLQFLHKTKGINTLAIEGGTSTAYLINRYLESGDTLLLREIVRHTFYWGKEHHEFLSKLCAWNRTLPQERKIIVRSGDIEIKQECVVLALNILLDGRTIPPVIARGLEGLQNVFKQKQAHRQQFQALNVLYYYDKDQCRELIEFLIADLRHNETPYKDFFGKDLELFKTMINDLAKLYEFNYRRDMKFMYRDELIFSKLLKLAEACPGGFLYVVGAKHTRPGSSSSKLASDPSSPLKDQVIFISTTGRKKRGKYNGAGVVTRLLSAYPIANNSENVILIKNDVSNHPLTQPIHYTLAYGNNKHVRPFSVSYTGK